VGRITRCGDIADFSLRMCISTIFILPAEVLVKDSESHTPISYSSFIVTMALSGLVVSFQDIVMDNGINRRQTPDARQTIPLLKLSHLLLQANRGPPNNQPVLTHQAFELAYHMAVDIGSTVPLRRFSITRRLYRKKERRFVRFQSLGT